MDRKARLFVTDMLAYAREVMSFVEGRSEDDLESDNQFRFAVIYGIQTLGEAAKNVPKDIRDLAPGIPWREISKTRDIIVHHYFGVRFDVVWRVAQVELPKLIPLLEELLALDDDA
ncbi:MAG: DUF86 domain-containing protein [Fimbriimonadaceae bacterium]